MSQRLSSTGVTFSYGPNAALRGVSVGLSDGEFVAIIGPNGSGKTTLIRALLGHVHARGDITWDDKPLRAWSRRSLARTIAYLPQSPSAEPDATVAQVLRLGRVPYWSGFGIESGRDTEVVDQVAHRLALEEILTRRMDELSGGQRQRVFIGRCLTQEPRAMLLDEPSTFLDLRHQVELAELLRTLARSGIAILMASHDLNLAAMFTDRMILLNEGAIEAQGAAASVLDPKLLSRVYGTALRRVEPAGSSPIVAPDLAQ
ncbi:MAG: ABC transporter ATP-binding protein [Tepidisphaeraceae bacterium]